jgi:hypothetical protein
MPYVDEDRAEALDAGGVPIESGDLAYLLAKQIDAFLGEDTMKWALINMVLGALEGVKFEFQCRVQREYEDAKLAKGGADPFERAVAEAGRAWTD